MSGMSRRGVPPIMGCNGLPFIATIHAPWLRYPATFTDMRRMSRWRLIICLLGNGKIRVWIVSQIKDTVSHGATTTRANIGARQSIKSAEVGATPPESIPGCERFHDPTKCRYSFLPIPSIQHQKLRILPNYPPFCV